MFKRKKQPVVEVAVAEMPVTAKEIQMDVVHMQEELLAEAKRIIAGGNKDVDRARRLSALGFANVPEMKAYQEIRIAEQAVEYERKYALEWPGMKFIPGEAMQKVCFKYGLLMGGVHRYTGKVPDWAIDRIETMKPALTRYQKSGPLELFSAIPHEDRQHITSEGFSLFIWFRTKSKEIAEKYGFTEAMMPLMIAAPRNEMQMSEWEKGRVQNNRIVEDPIVFFDVPGGHICVVAWGEEGSDPGVFNANQN